MYMIIYFQAVILSSGTHNVYDVYAFVKIKMMQFIVLEETIYMPIIRNFLYVWDFIVATSYVAKSNI